MSHGASVLFLNGRFESSSFHAEHFTANNKYEFASKNKVISPGGDDHILGTEPVEVTGNTFCVTNSFPTTDKCKFSGQENISCEFYEVKLGKQGFALRHKLLSEASDAFTAVNKALSEVSDGFTATDKVLSEPSDAFTATDKVPSEVSDAFTAIDKVPSEASDALPAIDEVLSEASDGFTALDRALSEASDGLPAIDRAPSEASDALPAIDEVLSEASDGFTANDKALSEVSDEFTATNRALSETSDASTATEAQIFDAQDMLGDQTVIEPVEITNMETTAAFAAAKITHKKEFFMKEIQSIPLTSMNNGAHFTFVSNMAERAEKDSTVSEKCAAQVTALREAVKAEDENLQISAKSLTTDKIADADRLRDQLYAGYKKAVAGYANFPLESMAEAAKVLQQHIKDYKIDVQAQLDKETGLLVNFIQDLEGKFAAQVKELSLGAFVEKLKVANEEVRSLTGQRTDERSAKTAGALKAARAASDEAYRMLVLHVNAHALLEGDAAYAAFIDYANTEIEHFRKEVLGGAKKKPATSADEAE